MFRRIVFVLIVMLLNPSYAQIAYPGYFSGSVLNPGSVLLNAGPERKNTITTISIQQGVDWLRFGDHLTLNTYVGLNYVRDNANLDWNNKSQANIGVKLRANIGSGVVDLFVQQVREKRYINEANDVGTQAGLTWWFEWGRR